MVLLLKSVKVINFDNYFYKLLLKRKICKPNFMFRKDTTNHVFLGFYKKNK